MTDTTQSTITWTLADGTIYKKITVPHGGLVWEETIGQQAADNTGQSCSAVDDEGNELGSWTPARRGTKTDTVPQTEIGGNHTPLDQIIPISHPITVEDEAGNPVVVHPDGSITKPIDVAPMLPDGASVPGADEAMSAESDREMAAEQAEEPATDPLDIPVFLRRSPAAKTPVTVTDSAGTTNEITDTGLDVTVNDAGEITQAAPAVDFEAMDAAADLPECDLVATTEALQPIDGDAEGGPGADTLDPLAGLGANTGEFLDAVAAGTIEEMPTAKKKTKKTKKEKTATAGRRGRTSPVWTAIEQQASLGEVPDRYVIASEKNKSYQHAIDEAREHCINGDVGALETQAADIKGTNTYAKAAHRYIAACLTAIKAAGGKPRLIPERVETVTMNEAAEAGEVADAILDTIADAIDTAEAISNPEPEGSPEAEEEHETDITDEAPATASDDQPPVPSEENEGGEPLDPGTTLSAG